MQLRRTARVLATVMKKIVGSILTLFVVFLLLDAQIRMLRIRSPETSANGFVYARGNAPDAVRAEVLAKLREFQRGYELRDVTRVAGFTGDVFADNVLVLGTQPREVRVGRDDVADLIGEDWESWGNCRFDIEKTHVSSRENVAWFATTGRVRFDLSRFLILPLRLSGVMVREAAGWRIQYLQYQFDLDNSFSLLILFVLLVWLAGLSIALLVRSVLQLRRRRE